MIASSIDAWWSTVFSSILPHYSNVGYTKPELPIWRSVSVPLKLLKSQWCSLSYLMCIPSQLLCWSLGIFSLNVFIWVYCQEGDKKPVSCTFCDGVVQLFTPLWFGCFLWFLAWISFWSCWNFINFGYILNQGRHLSLRDVFPSFSNLFSVSGGQVAAAIFGTRRFWCVSDRFEIRLVMSGARFEVLSLAIEWGFGGIARYSHHGPSTTMFEEFSTPIWGF